MPEPLKSWLTQFGPTVGAVLALVLMHVVATRLLSATERLRHERAFVRQLLLAVIWTVGLVMVLLALPINDETQGQLLSLVGILLSAAIALSSTTLLSNAIAGFVLRGQGSIRIGDFIEVDGHFGRVTDLGLVQSEIQTEQRNLTSFPNSYLVQNAVTTYRDSGTLISAEVSLGYDVGQKKVKAALVRAAQSIELEDPFVQVLELGDFSIVYRVVGLLKNTRKIVTMRSKLRSAMIDELHGAGIEIMSPNFMNQRRIDETPVIPKREWNLAQTSGEGTVPEDLMFDKAIEAETLEKYREVYEDFGERLSQVEAKLKHAEPASTEHTDLLRRREKLQTQRRRLQALIEGHRE